MLVLVAYVLTASAGALAWAIARRRAEHRTVALLLTVGLASDLAQRALHVLCLAPGYLRFGTGPLAGRSRAAGHLSVALFLLWPAAIAAAAPVTFDPKPAGEPAASARHRRILIAVGLVWLLAVLALAVTYPTTRGPVLARCYLAAELGAIVVGIGTIGTWIPARQSPEIHHLAIALVVGAELVSALAGPWRFDLFGSWSLAVVSRALLLGVLVALQGGLLWWVSTSARP